MKAHAERERMTRLASSGDVAAYQELLRMHARVGDFQAIVELARLRGVPVPHLVKVPAGTDILGSPPDEEGRWENEQQITATFEAPFWIGSAPVTQAEYKAVVGRNPSHFKKGENAAQRPVECVSWFDAIEYCNKLSELCGLPVAYLGDRHDGFLWRGGPGFRLPTEAEWEYAARAGSDGPRYDILDASLGQWRMADLDEIAWYDGNSAGQTHSVRCKLPNAWGLFDVLGLVWEWCWDEYSGSLVVATPDVPFDSPMAPSGAVSSSSDHGDEPCAEGLATSSSTTSQSGNDERTTGRPPSTNEESALHRSADSPFAGGSSNRASPEAAISSSTLHQADSPSVSEESNADSSTTTPDGTSVSGRAEDDPAPFAPVVSSTLAGSTSVSQDAQASVGGTSTSPSGSPEATADPFGLESREACPGCGTPDRPSPSASRSERHSRVTSSASAATGSACGSSEDELHPLQRSLAPRDWAGVTDHPFSSRLSSVEEPSATTASQSTQGSEPARVQTPSFPDIERRILHSALYETTDRSTTLENGAASELVDAYARVCELLRSRAAEIRPENNARRRRQSAERRRDDLRPFGAAASSEEARGSRRTISSASTDDLPVTHQDPGTPPRDSGSSVASNSRWYQPPSGTQQIQHLLDGSQTGGLTHGQIHMAVPPLSHRQSRSWLSLYLLKRRYEGMRAVRGADCSRPQRISLFHRAGLVREGEARARMESREHLGSATGFVRSYYMPIVTDVSGLRVAAGECHVQCL